MLIAVEPSGDALGAALLPELRAVAPGGSIFTGCGGLRMAAAGLDSLFPIDRFSVMGPTGALAALPEALKRASELADRAAADHVDAAIFIDGWTFSRLGASRMRAKSPKTKLFKFAAPQVWASRPSRVRVVSRRFDGVLCLLPFEPPYFTRAGAKAEFVGNPNYQAAFAARGDGRMFRARHGIGEAPLLLVLPGSRNAEARRLIGPFEEAARIVAGNVSGLRVAALLHPAVEAFARPLMASWPGAPILAGEAEKADLFCAASAALAKSGTVATELAINGVPMVVAYKVDALTAWWARRVVTAKYATILNLVAGREVIPEFLQEECRPDRLAGHLIALMTDREARLEQVEAFPPLLAKLGVDGPPAARLAARHIARWMSWPAASSTA
jgi:lipid-A-disaccharide synthase